MLKIIISKEEYFDEEKEEFIESGGVEIELEHSLVSLSKWESEFQKPFLETNELEAKELLWYVQAMIQTPGIDQEVLLRMTTKDFVQINDYIASPQSATTFGSLPRQSGRAEIITSELIYYWMVAFNIPFECQYWHLNRLFALIKICNIKNAKPQKMSAKARAMQYRDMNAQRKAALGTTG